MGLHGSVTKNLTSALYSARRLRGRAVHPDTVTHWSDVLRYTREKLGDGTSASVLALCAELEQELAY